MRALPSLMRSWYPIRPAPRTWRPNGGYVCPYCTEAFPKEQFTEVKDTREAKEVCERLRKTQQGMPVGHDKNLTGGSSEGVASTDEPGVLAPIAAQVVMKVFYVAREARPDLLRAIGYLSRYLTKWNKECDRRLHRLMEYVNSTQYSMSVGWIGDKIEDLR